MRSTSFRAVVLRHPDPWPDIVDDIKSHSFETYPEEACGIVVDGTYIRCKNTHPNPREHFRIDPGEFGAYVLDGTLQAVVHSHPDGPNHPTFDDTAGQIEWGVPWGICSVIGDTKDAVCSNDIVWWGDGLPPVPLERRKFVWGVFTCYQLYRDWWKQERGVILPTWPMHEDFVQRGMDIFTDYREKVGLTDLGKTDISNLQVGDMLLGKLRGSFPNHCGIYVGNDLMLHHPPTGVSGTTELLRWWPYVERVYRNESASNSPSARGIG
jgi:proteasome lid subunit RPN8/RPN11